ncbi:MAG: sulfurtransferase [Thermaerobacter sp.]|nr:sulfurtransferase [Thermaerobacter sp.]
MPFAPHDPVVAPDWLAQRLGDSDLVIVDCRWNLANPALARAQYQAAHIPDAYYLDMEDDLSGPKHDHGGRHPLPEPQAWSHIMNRIGVRPDTRVVAYDADGVGAARLWWLMNYFGHERTYVLNGGLNAWTQAGHPLTSTPALPQSGRFVAHPDPSLTISLHDLLTAPAAPRTLVDARSADRYRGETEPIDARAGHIPQAINISWADMLDGPARYRDATDLRQTWSPIGDTGEVVVYCGSGVSACVNILAMHRVGRSARLYPGSWSDWSSYPHLPVAVGPF